MSKIFIIFFSISFEFLLPRKNFYISECDSKISLISNSLVVWYVVSRYRVTASLVIFIRSAGCRRFKRIKKRRTNATRVNKSIAFFFFIFSNTDEEISLLHSRRLLLICGWIVRVRACFTSSITAGGTDQ